MAEQAAGPQIDAGTELDASDTLLFRRALGRFASGVVVITAMDGDPVGMTCQSFSSLSLDPPLVLFSANSDSHSLVGLRRAGKLCINVLAKNQDSVSAQFGRRGPDKWAGVAWLPGRNGAPRLEGAALWVEGEIRAVHPGGDHDIVVVEVSVLGIASDTHSPLIFHDGRYAGVCTWQGTAATPGTDAIGKGT